MRPQAQTALTEYNPLDPGPHCFRLRNHPSYDSAMPHRISAYGDESAGRESCISLVWGAGQGSSALRVLWPSGFGAGSSGLELVEMRSRVQDRIDGLVPLGVQARILLAHALTPSNCANALLPFRSLPGG